VDLAVETQGLVKVYREGRTEVRALDGVDLRVPRGSVFGLFGPNGSGKTTLISILVGLLLPTSGTAKVLGLDAVRQSLEVRRRVGLLPEGFGFYEHMTALENLVFFGMLDGLPEAEARARAQEALELVGLSEWAGTKVSAFSRGMVQRLGIAQALLKDPELLILDEPTVGLDPDGVAQFRLLVRELAGRGKTLIISTHLLQEVGSVCTHAAIIRRGRILVQGSLEELASQVRAYEVRVSVGAEALARELGSQSGVTAWPKGTAVRVAALRDVEGDVESTAARCGARVEAVVRVSPTWEDVYRLYQGGSRW